MPLEIKVNESGLSAALYWADDDGHRSGEPIAVCAAACKLGVVPGEYVVVGFDGTRELGSDRLTIDGPILLEVRRPEPGRSRLGLVLGISGAVVAWGGSVAITVAMLRSLGEPCEHCSNNTAPLFYGGLVALGVGAAVTSVGWVQFAKGRRWLKDIDIDLDAAPGRVGLAGVVRF